MNKAHSNINWENYPSGNTPINDENLNKMDISIDTIDDRVITLDTTKANKIEVAQLIKDISFDESTGVFTITKKDGSKFTIDTKLEKIAVNFAYDTELQQIMLTLVDGTIERIDLSDFVTQYEFLDTDTISFSTDNFGNVYAIVKEGSVEEKHLRPNYLAEIKVEAAKAQESATNAAKSENNAKVSENVAKASQNAAKISEDNATASALIAAQEASNASDSATSAATSATNAAASEETASEMASNATSAATSAIDAKDEAADYNENAGNSANNALNYAKQSQSYAVGTGNVRPNEATDSAKYYYEQSKNIYENFENSGNVTGVKGNLENTYRAGNVNLTTADIGAVNKGGDTMSGELIVLSSRSTTKAPSLPFCGRVDNGIYAIENLSNYRTFLGSYYDEDGMWWNAISIRHGNGWNDGQYLGMYLRSKLLDNGDLLWGKQIGSTKGWQDERTILDSVNYKSYCTPANIGLENVNNTPDYLKQVKAASYLTGWGDTRNVETKPSDYSEMFKPVGLKTPAASKITTGSSFATLVGIRGWSDASAGKAHELAFDGNGKLLHRVGLTSWEGWREIAHIDDLTIENIGALSLNGGQMKDNATIYMKGTDTSILLSANNGTSSITNNIVSVENNGCRLSLRSKIGTSDRCGMEALTKSNSRTGGLYFYNGDIFPSAYSRLNISITKNPEIARSYTFDETGLWSIVDDVDLGKSSFHWRNIYANNGTIQTSDRTKKTNINNLDIQKIKSFIMGLIPSSYEMIDGTSGRTHYGLIAQDVEELMKKLNMDSSDFAGFIKSPKKIIKYEDENGKKLENPIEEIIEGEYDYSLRYDEFIAPLIKVVQEQQREIEELKEDIKFLKEYIYAR